MRGTREGAFGFEFAFGVGVGVGVESSIMLDDFM